MWSMIRAILSFNPCLTQARARPILDNNYQASNSKCYPTPRGSEMTGLLFQIVSTCCMKDILKGLSCIPVSRVPLIGSNGEDIFNLKLTILYSKNT